MSKQFKQQRPTEPVVAFKPPTVGAFTGPHLSVSMPAPTEEPPKLAPAAMPAVCCRNCNHFLRDMCHLNPPVYSIHEQGCQRRPAVLGTNSCGSWETASMFLARKQAAWEAARNGGGL